MRHVGDVASSCATALRSLAIDADRVFHAASTMKVPVLIELERQAVAGELPLDDALIVRNAFRSLPPGSSRMVRTPSADLRAQQLWPSARAFT